MKFDRALFSIKISFAFQMSNYLRCKVFFRENPPEKTDSYSREKERSLGIEKKMIIAYTIIMTVILVIVKK